MYRRILVPIDGSPTAHAGLSYALALTAVYGCELCLLYVIDDVPVVNDLWSPGEFEAFLQRQRQRGQALLEEARASCANAGQDVQAYLHEVGGGKVADVIVRQAKALDCDLIVIGSHGRRGMRRLVMGSDAEAVLRHAAVPVIVIRAVAAGQPERALDERVPYRRLLVPIDGCETSVRGLDEAIRLAQRSNAHVRLLHVIDELSMAVTLNPALTLGMDWMGMLRMSGSTLLARATERVRAAGLESDSVLVDNFKRRLSEVVAQEAASWPADVIVLGSHGRRGFDRVLIGSDAEQIMRHASVPVLLVPSAQRVES